MKCWQRGRVWRCEMLEGCSLSSHGGIQADSGRALAEEIAVEGPLEELCHTQHWGQKRQPANFLKLQGATSGVQPFDKRARAPSPKFMGSAGLTRFT